LQPVLTSLKQLSVFGAKLRSYLQSPCDASTQRQSAQLDGSPAQQRQPFANCASATACVPCVAALAYQLVMLHAVDVMSPASQACRSVLKQLLDQNWASKVFGNLTQLLTPEPQAAKPAAPAGAVHAVSYAPSQMVFSSTHAGCEEHCPPIEHSALPSITQSALLLC
jgi:hypothetical protein